MLLIYSTFYLTPCKHKASKYHIFCNFVWKLGLPGSEFTTLSLVVG